MRQPRGGSSGGGERVIHFGKEGVPETVVPKISQETIAEIMGTTGSQVVFFMSSVQTVRLRGLRWERAASPQLAFSTLFSTMELHFEKMSLCSRANLAGAPYNNFQYE